MWKSCTVNGGSISCAPRESENPREKEEETPTRMKEKKKKEEEDGMEVK